MMGNIIRDDKHGVEVYYHTADSVWAEMHFGSWMLAYINHGIPFMEENFKKVERHNDSDEVFILLAGEATLIIGEELNRIEMEPHKIYNVPKGVWHHIFTKEGTSVLVVERDDTHDENTEYLYVNK